MAALRYSVRVDYQPMTVAGLAAFVAAEPDFDVRWRLVVEFLKEYHREPAGERQRLLADIPGSSGDERWDVLFAGLAEHLAMRDGEGRSAVVGIARVEALLVPVRYARRARRPSCMPLQPSAGAACSLPTMRSTLRERSLAAA